MNMNEEQSRVAEFFARLNHTEDIPERIAIINDMFAYLITTKELLKIDMFRTSVWNKIYELEQYAELNDVIARLKPKLLEYGPVVPKPAPISPNLKYIAKGSYGCAVEPALPNEVDGVWKEYPSNISKLFYTKGNYDKLLAKQAMIHNVFGETNDYTISPYMHKFSYKNIPKRVRRNCEIGKKDLHIVRMPNLGISVHKANKESAKYMPILKALPIQTLLQEIMKLCVNVKSLKDKDIIHGDIRETNVMIDPNTGKLTIIDFDWLLPTRQFLLEYSFGFYNNPPEALMTDRVRNLERIHIHEDFFDELDSDGETQEYIHQSNLYKYREDLGVTLDKYTLTDANMENLSHIVELSATANTAGGSRYYNNYMDRNSYDENNSNRNNYYPPADPTEILLKEEIVKTFDSYGLGITLAALLYAIYPEEFKAESNKPIHSLIHTIVKPMIALEMKDRMNIDTAISELETLQASLVAQGGVRSSKSKRKSKSKTRSTKPRRRQNTRKNRK